MAQLNLLDNVKAVILKKDYLLMDTCVLLLCEHMPCLSGCLQGPEGGVSSSGVTDR